MTAKRFTVPENYRCIQDNLTKEHYICEDKTEAINLAYLLNDLHKENELLKTQLQNTSDQRDEFHRGARENANRVGELKKENKQLKSFIKELTSNDGKIWLMNGYVYKTDKILKGDVE